MHLNFHFTWQYNIYQTTHGLSMASHGIWKWINKFKNDGLFDIVTVYVVKYDEN